MKNNKQTNIIIPPSERSEKKESSEPRETEKGSKESMQHNLTPNNRHERAIQHEK